MRPGRVRQDSCRHAGPARDQRLLAEGISINVTLIFSPARYSEVIEAFLAGLEAARAVLDDLATLGID